MKISLNWLSNYVDLSALDASVVADRLTLSTAEVDGIEVLDNSAASAVVASVASVMPAGLTNGKPLMQVEVDTGSARYTTMSTAPNLSAGMRAAFVPPGVALQDKRVETAEIEGWRSEGMLCSMQDLGIGRFHESVIECPAHAKLGTSLGEWIPARDVLIEIDNKSLTNRPDLWGHYGFARELAAILGRELKPLEVVDLAGFAHLPEYAVSNEDQENCPVYTCIALDVARNMPSSLEMQARLHLLDQRAYNVLIDVTNYVALEIGQPTHAFDRAFVPAVRVAPRGAADMFTTLDGEKREMEPDDLMIWNDRDPIAIAGIMGGLGSDVRSDTTRLLLESANFKASRVRRTSTRLALRTDASQRFEKGQPPSNAQIAAARICRLLEIAGTEPKPISRLTIAGDLKDRPRTVMLEPNYISRMAGVDINDDRVTEILGSLGFGTQIVGSQLEVSIPPFRSEQDVSIPADILEEVLRVYGYAAIPPQVPETRLEPTPLNLSVRREHKARRILSGAHRFHEVQTYIWYDDAWLRTIAFDPAETLALRNPIADGRARLRTTILPNLLAVIAQNIPHSDAFRLFEVGRVFEAHGGAHRETTRLTGASFRRGPIADVEEHYREIRGAVEDLVQTLTQHETVVETAIADGMAPWCSAHLWGPIKANGHEVGATGILSGTILEAVAPEAQVVWFDLDMAALDGPLYPVVKYGPPPVYPGSWQDFSLRWRTTDGFAELQRKLDQFKSPLLNRREFIGSYKGKGLNLGEASYTFRFLLIEPTRTMTNDDLEAFRNDFLGFLHREGITLR